MARHGSSFIPAGNGRVDQKPKQRLRGQARLLQVGLPPRSWTLIQPLGVVMSKYTEQFKLTAITAYLEGPYGFRKVAQHLGVDCSLLRRWVASYQAHSSVSPRPHPQ
ncbi:transposase, partial [Pseudomonas asplenii]|uniref:transposase n=1 Tax=Pseudomonas asplenii TaxID=53407 RepID=UPI0012FD10CF